MRRSGFTLVEVVVSSAILLVVIGVAFETLLRATNHSTKGVVISTLRTRSQQTLDRMRRDLEQTSVNRIYTNFATRTRPAPGATVTRIDFQVCQRGATDADVSAAKALDPASTLAVGDPIYETQARGYRHDAARAKLVFQIPGGPAVDIADQVSSFQVSLTGQGRVQVAITFQADDPDSRVKGKKIQVTETAVVVPANP